MIMKMRMIMRIIIDIFFQQNIRMSYYLFNLKKRQETLRKAKKKNSKEKAAEYYLQNKEVIKGKKLF